MQHWIKGSVVASLLLSGCSLLQNDATQNNSADSVSAIKVPTGLQQPAQPGQFNIPEGATGEAVSDTRAPALVLATAASSRVEEGDRLPRVWFDRTDYTGDLVPFLQRMVQQYLNEQGLTSTTDASGLVYTTQWIGRSRQNGFWLWSTEETQDQARFKVAIEPRPHGRSASVTVSMEEHQYFVPDAALTKQDMQRQEVALLNRIIDRVGKEEISVAIAQKSKIPDVSLEPGLDKDGNAALLTPQPIDVVWSQLETLFTELNVDINDKDRSVYTYYLNYDKSEQGFWSKIWGDAPKPVLPLEPGEYQLVLAKADKQTAITVRDKEGAQLDPQTMLALYEPFVQAIRYARLEM